MQAIIATNPQQMQHAQAVTTGWVGTKLAEAQQDLKATEQAVEALKAAGLTVNSRLITSVRRNKKRIRFYEKVRKALDAGYYIIPPFDIQLFAVRTDRAVSPDQTSDRRWNSDAAVEDLPPDTGRWVNPVLRRFEAGVEKQVGHDGKPFDVRLFTNENYRGVELPIRAVKPTIIDAVGKALGERIFDALGIAPAYRAADPIIAGQIKRPDGGALTFLVAWWLDAEDL